jgi:hypothetical protein
VARELAYDLASRVLAAVTADAHVRLETRPDAPALYERSGSDTRAVAAALAEALRGAGLRVAAATEDAPTTLVIGCSRNLRDVVCTVAVTRGQAQDVVFAARPRTAVVQEGRLASLDVRPVFASSTRILDLVLAGRQMLVLDTVGVTLYEWTGSDSPPGAPVAEPGQAPTRQAGGWAPRASQPLQPALTWPRDPRGRLVVAGGSFDAFLPGMRCRGAIEPLAISCAAGNPSWPLGLDNAGLAAGRNYFIADDIQPFFAAARTSGRAGAAWIVAGADGKVLLLDEVRTPVGDADVGGVDLVGLATACGSGQSVVLCESPSVAGGPRPPADALRGFDVTDRRLVPLTARVLLPGPLVALWPAAGEASAVAVAHNVESSRYEAFAVRLLCVR